MEGSFRLQDETNLQTRGISRFPRENIRKGIIYLWKFRCVRRERDNGLRMEQFFSFFGKEKFQRFSINVSYIL